MATVIVLDLRLPKVELRPFAWKCPYKTHHTTLDTLGGLKRTTASLALKEILTVQREDLT